MIPAGTDPATQFFVSPEKGASLLLAFQLQIVLGFGTHSTPAPVPKASNLRTGIGGWAGRSEL